jgi:transcriptional enhancer factor
MELQHHHSCVLPANGSEFDPSSLGTSLDGPPTQHRGVLQERSINWPHEHSTASPVTNTLYTSSRKPSRSQSPVENVYSHQSNPGGTYFTGNVHAHHIGLAGFGVERPAKQIKLELKRLYQMLDRSDKYKKYREKQPVLTPAEFLAREERERRNKVDKDKSPEKSVWPEFLERAFWTGEWEHSIVARYRSLKK